MRLIDSDKLKDRIVLDALILKEQTDYNLAGIPGKVKDLMNLLYENVQKRIDEAPTLDVEPKWIPCSERLPEEHEWIGTKRFGTTISDEVYVTFENPKGERFTEHLSFQNGKLSSSDQRKIDAFYKGSVPIAWMPLPKPYRERKEE